MKLLITILLMTFSAQTQAQTADQKILDYKDWGANKVAAHKVSGESACVARTVIKNKDTSLEIYMEANVQGGYVEPVVQIVSTDLPPALGAVANISGHKLPMTIVLKETKEVEKEVLEAGSSIPVLKKVEQQIFIGKFKDKREMIKLIRDKSNVKTSFYDATGVIGSETFSLRGSNRTVGAALKACL